MVGIVFRSRPIGGLCKSPREHQSRSGRLDARFVFHLPKDDPEFDADPGSVWKLSGLADAQANKCLILELSSCEIGLD
jgi:hypothetical protein